jgi:hypothetical protein
LDIGELTTSVYSDKLYETGVIDRIEKHAQFLRDSDREVFDTIFGMIEGQSH